MTDTLLALVARRFGVAIDPDSDGGQILNSLTPLPSSKDVDLIGQASVAPLTLALTSTGVSVHAASASDALVFNLPAGPVKFALVPGNAHQAPTVEVQLLPVAVPVPFLRPATLGEHDRLEPAAGGVTLQFPDLLLVVSATASSPAGARLAPSHGAAGAQMVTMEPGLALFDADAVVGFKFDRAELQLEGSGEPEIRIPNLEVYVAPPGLPALAMHGGGRDLHLSLAVGRGLSGDFELALATGAQAAARPRFLHDMAAHLRLDRGFVTLLELTGRIDLGNEVKARVGDLDDGAAFVRYVLGVTLDDGWRVHLSLRAEGGGSFLWRTQRPDADPKDLSRDTLGAYAVFAPLLAPNLPDAGASGYVDLALVAGAAGGLAASEWVSTRSLTLFGAELTVHRSPSGSEAFLFFDIETQLDLTVKMPATDKPLLSTKRPLKVRHRAIGLRLDFGANTDAPTLKPVFDPLQGFSLDLSDPGMFEVPGPLGDIVQPQGIRTARENPLFLEVDLGLKADLGVVTIDRATVRVPLDSPGAPTLTALGAHVNVPGALSGSGYLRIKPDGGFAGQLDVSLTPLNLRVAAGLVIQHDHDVDRKVDVDGVLVTLGVEFPVPIPLASSGLGLFGFLGLFAMHFTRKQDASQSTLDWFKDTARGDVTSIHAWKAKGGRWNLGLGAVVGTLEGGFLVHAKGMIVIELPGPAVLLAMNADILGERPVIPGDETGTLLAIIEFRPDESVTLGIIAQKSLKPLLDVRIPAEAYFPFTGDITNWHLDVGRIKPLEKRASVEFLSAFRANGYLEVHGNGIKDFPPLEASGGLRGMSVAAGVGAPLKWEPEEIGLYLKVAAGADVGIGFKPFLLAGSLALGGALHLFIIGIEAAAAATIVIGESFFLSAEVRGAIDFFFFELEGSVTIELGKKPQPPPAEPLVRALSLHSRSPALLAGSATDRPVDSSLGNAARLAGGQWIGAQFQGKNLSPGEFPVVPVDVIPVLQFEMGPAIAPDCKFFDQAIRSKLAPKDWQRRGPRYYRYTLKSLTLSATGQDNAPVDKPLLDVGGKTGDTPAVWWDRYGRRTGGDDNDVQLALLNWTPDPTPAAAAARTATLHEQVRRRWGSVCAEAAPATRVLWSFAALPAGRSQSGWTAQGLALPDPSGTVRSSSPRLALRVTEPWRSGNTFADALTGATPAYICGKPLVLARPLVAPRTGLQLSTAVPNDNRIVELLRALRPHGFDSLADALRFNTDGLSTVRLLLFVPDNVWNGLLMLRPLNATATETGPPVHIDPGSSRLVHTLADLPAEWSHPASPWMPTVEALLNSWFQFYSGSFDIPLVFVETDLPRSTTQVEVGITTDLHWTGPTWGVLALEAITEAERTRVDYDEEQRARQITEVEGALNADDANRALLRPNTTYTVTVGYDVEVTGADAHGNPAGEPLLLPKAAATQQFRFRTDDKPPDRLDGWVLATDPHDHEQYFFYGDPLRVVFSTPATRQLFKAYDGRELFAVAKAASGKQPDPAKEFDPTTVRLVDTVVKAKRLPAAARRPFDDALSDVVADLPCLRPQRANPHELITLTMKLQPLTEYVLDLEARPASDSSYPLFRRFFTTSRYQDMPTMAAEVAKRGVNHRRCADTAPLAALALPAADPKDLGLQLPVSVVEGALRAIQWGDLLRPTEPRVTVIWADGTPPQPVALLLETPEPLWRWRDVPAPVKDEHGMTRQYRLQPTPWLDIIETPTAGRLVTRLIYSVDGARTLALLDGARGGTLSLALRRTFHSLFEGPKPPPPAIHTLVAATLDSAPGEKAL